MAKLIVHYDEGESTFAIDSDVTLLGRDARCDIRIPNRSVAPLHCKVIRGVGKYVFEQIDPDTYTLINGRVVSSGTLRDGDRIEFGKFVVVFRDDRDFSRDASFFEECDGEPPSPADDVAAQGAPLDESAEAPSSEPQEETAPAAQQGEALPAPDAKDGGEAHPAADVEDAPGDAQRAKVEAPRPVRPLPEPGRMVRCKFCAEWYSSRDEICPRCGKSAPPDESAPELWYYLVNDQVEGPMNVEFIVRKIDEGAITPETLVRAPGADDFVPAGRVRGIARFFERCHHCQTPVEESQVFCHACGEPLHEEAKPPAPPKRSAAVLWARIAVRVLLIALVVIVVLGAAYVTGFWRVFVPPQHHDRVERAVERILPAPLRP